MNRDNRTNKANNLKLRVHEHHIERKCRSFMHWLVNERNYLGALWIWKVDFWCLTIGEQLEIIKSIPYEYLCDYDKNWTELREGMEAIANKHKKRPVSAEIPKPPKQEIYIELNNKSDIKL